MRRLLAVLLVSLCFQVQANDVDDRRALAQRLADLLEIRAQYEFFREKCAQSDADLEKVLLELHAKHPADFGGISPQSAYWPEVRQIYREYFEEGCSHASGAKMEPLFVKNYAATMTLAELNAAVTFYSSPAGQGVQAASRKVFKEVAEVVYGGAIEKQEVATLTFQQSMLILRNKYKAKPK
jgi:hypothetical protein